MTVFTAAAVLSGNSAYFHFTRGRWQACPRGESAGRGILGEGAENIPLSSPTLDQHLQKTIFATWLAPSGALIAIPTYYWSTTPPPHFFRSHRSSTLDFHFLSHYSYIKAIKLYKGNHWTRSAGFMDTLWVRLGIIALETTYLSSLTWGEKSINLLLIIY